MKQRHHLPSCSCSDETDVATSGRCLQSEVTRGVALYQPTFNVGECSMRKTSVTVVLRRVFVQMFWFWIVSCQRRSDKSKIRDMRSQGWDDLMFFDFAMKTWVIIWGDSLWHSQSVAFPINFSNLASKSFSQRANASTEDCLKVSRRQEITISGDTESSGHLPTIPEKSRSCVFNKSRRRVCVFSFSFWSLGLKSTRQEQHWNMRIKIIS